MANDVMGRLLPFDRNAEQVRSLATRQQEYGNPLTALELLHISRSKSPCDPETILATAEAYASMQCWALSNVAYFSLARDEAYAADCFYGLGANYFAMHMYAAAQDCFTLALQKAPDADFAPDAVELLDAIDDASQEMDPLEQKLQQRMGRVMDAMEAGRARLASRQIRRVLALDHKSAGIHALHAFALLAAGDGEASLCAARKAYRADRGDIRALCAMASALKAMESVDAARAFLSRAEARMDREDDLHLVCQTACEMGEHAYVVALLEKVEGKAPYRDDTMYTLACALHNSGQTEEAMRRWRILRRIDPMDTVSAYWLALAEAGELPEEIPYTRQVPLRETLLRLDRIRGWVHDGPKALRRHWQDDSAFESYLRWGLSSSEAGVPQAMCGILSSIGDARAQAILTGLLCDAEASDALKHTALAALHQAGADGPFYALMQDRLTLVHVSKAQDSAATAGKEADKLVKLARRWIPEDAAETPLIRALALLAARVKTPSLTPGHKARAMVLAYCDLCTVQAPMSSTFATHRKVERLARHILQEVNHGLHQL